MNLILLKDYISKQIRFSIGNTVSIPIGTFLLYFFTHYIGIWYIYSSLLSFIVTTSINFNMARLLHVVKLNKEKIEINSIAEQN